MLLRWDIENPGQLKPFLTPEPQWNGCTYTESYNLPTARTQEGGQDRPPELVGDWETKEDFLKSLDIEGYLCDSGIRGSCNDPGTATGAETGQSPLPGTDLGLGDALSSAQASEPGLAEQTAEPKRKERRGRRRGGRRGSGRGGHGKSQP